MNGDGEVNGVDDGQEKTLTINGKKVDKEPDEEELSEEDQNLKSELEMLITRLKEPDMSLYLPALITMKDFIKTSTSSMTAVPKPWKFLMPHYKDLTTTFESWPSGERSKGCSCRCPLSTQNDTVAGPHRRWRSRQWRQVLVSIFI